LKTERLKSYILMLLVAMSFVLTTRIWFYISIEGLFAMPQSNQPQTALSYKKENLLKPGRLVVHTGQSHTLLFNNEKNKKQYDSILGSTKEILKNWIINYESYSLISLPKDQLGDIRGGRAVELIFETPMQLENIKGLLDIDAATGNEIKEIDSILIAPFDNMIYIVDESTSRIFQFTSLYKSAELRTAIGDIEIRNDFEYVFLNEFNDESYEYGDYAIAPVSVTTMAVPAVKREIEINTELSPEIARFFNDEIANISPMQEVDGKITFTDREEETLTIDANGVLEYYKYNVAASDVKYTELKEAIDIATQYVNQHLGFTYDFYLSGIESRIQGGRTSYIISYDYKYNGVPIITKPDTGSSAIEVEILGQEVKRYKRNVSVIDDQGETVDIKSFSDILDIVWGGLDQRLNEKRSESIVRLNDMYLAYLERLGDLTPVWVVDVRVEGKDEKQYDKKYFIGAEEGVILDEK